MLNTHSSSKESNCVAYCSYIKYCLKKLTIHYALLSVMWWWLWLTCFGPKLLPWYPTYIKVSVSTAYPSCLNCCLKGETSIMLHCQLCITQQYESLQKYGYFYNKGSYYQIDIFCCQQRLMGYKEGNHENALYIPWYMPKGTSRAKAMLTTMKKSNV